MIYILVALKCEAQAFIEKFKLDSTKQNENISVVISGVGNLNMKNTASKIVSKMREDDLILNVGICGASKNYSIGQLLDERDVELTSLDHEVDYTKYEVVDMESTGFKEATKGVKNSYIFKVVSDHFEPKDVTKDLAKKLVYKRIDEIMEKVS
jgi:nucleoside phosphorylase